jgi:hypothetical protein
MKAILLYFILHLGIGGMCGFTDIPMERYKIFDLSNGRQQIEFVYKDETKMIIISPSMPYWIEEVR